MITAAARAQMQVTNRGSTACQFFVGDLLTDLDVPPGETVTIGCAGNVDRQGSAVIEFTGVLPGEGH